MIDFHVSSPEVASALKVVTSAPVHVTRPALSARVIAQPNVTNTSEPFAVTLQIVDTSTGRDAEDPTGQVGATLEWNEWSVD